MAGSVAGRQPRKPARSRHYIGIESFLRAKTGEPAGIRTQDTRIKSPGARRPWSHLKAYGVHPVRGWRAPAPLHATEWYRRGCQRGCQVAERAQWRFGCHRAPGRRQAGFFRELDSPAAYPDWRGVGDAEWCDIDEVALERPDSRRSLQNGRPRVGARSLDYRAVRTHRRRSASWLLRGRHGGHIRLTGFVHRLRVRTRLDPELRSCRPRPGSRCPAAAASSGSGPSSCPSRRRPRDSTRLTTVSSRRPSSRTCGCRSRDIGSRQDKEVHIIMGFRVISDTVTGFARPTIYYRAAGQPYRREYDYRSGCVPSGSAIPKGRVTPGRYHR